MSDAGVGMGRMGEGEDKVRSHQSSSKAVPFGGVRGVWGLSCSKAMRRLRPER